MSRTSTAKPGTLKRRSLPWEASGPVRLIRTTASAMDRWMGTEASADAKVPATGTCREGRNFLVRGDRPDDSVVAGRGKV